MQESIPLVTTNWLAERLDNPTLRILDASWRMPGAGDASLDFRRRHIPGAIFFDIDVIAESGTTLPHMLPSPEAFGEAVGKLGVSNDHTIIVYDDEGIFSAARVWWMFRAMAHKAVFVLDGGLPKWRREFRAVNAEPVDYETQPYTALIKNDAIACAKDIRAAIHDGSAQIVDARPSGRFIGIDAEPRAGLRAGHIPGSVNIPYKSLLEETGEMKPAQELLDIFSSAGIERHKPLFTSCGSGVTAAIISLALAVIGYSGARLYDGSWAEWGDAKNDENLFPITTGQ